MGINFVMDIEIKTDLPQRMLIRNWYDLIQGHLTIIKDNGKMLENIWCKAICKGKTIDADLSSLFIILVFIRNPQNDCTLLLMYCLTAIKTEPVIDSQEIGSSSLSRYLTVLRTL